MPNEDFINLMDELPEGAHLLAAGDGYIEYQAGRLMVAHAVTQACPEMAFSAPCDPLNWGDR